MRGSAVEQQQPAAVRACLIAVGNMLKPALDSSGAKASSAVQEAVSLEVVDLTADSLEDDVVTPASKRSRMLPLPFSAPQPPPPPAKPDAKCAICLEPMAEMACGPCGCALPAHLCPSWLCACEGQA